MAYQRRNHIESRLTAVERVWGGINDDGKLNLKKGINI